MKTFLHLAAAVGILAAGPASADTITWYCVPNKTNLTSSGVAMDGAFQFELGVFKNGFTPLAANMADWAANWVSAGSASYNATTKSYNMNVQVTSNTVPFTVGASAYVWGKRASATGDEWILFRHSTWTWPDGATSPPAFHLWNGAEADQVVMGGVNPAPTATRLVSAAVFSFDQWKKTALVGEADTTATGDPDHDGVANLMEFVLGTSPKVADIGGADSVSLVTSGNARYLQASVPKNASNLAKVTVEVSDDLKTWVAGPTYTTEITNTTSLLQVRDKVPIGSTPRRFMRVKAEVP